VSQLELWQIDSVDQLRRLAPAWDRLWERSEVTLPTARAELVAQWVEHFGAGRALRVLVVEEGGDLVAALPLAGRRTHRVLPVGDVTWNYWSPNGELLVDPEADVPAVLDLLVAGLEQAPWPLLWLDLTPFETPRWQALLGALARRGLPADVHLRYRIGQAEVDGDFETYFAQRSRAHRQGVRKSLRRLERSGPVELAAFCDFTPEEVDRRLREALVIEDRSWKHAPGRTVLSTRGMFEFYRRQARQLAEWGYLRLAFLEHRGKPIAFELGWTAKGVYHCFKVGYDPQCRGSSPGHVLRMLLLQAFAKQPGHLVVDFQGPLTEAVARWSTGSYPIGRLVIAPRRLAGRVLMTGYRALAPVIRRLRAASGGTRADNRTKTPGDAPENAVPGRSEEPTVGGPGGQTGILVS